MSVNIVNKTTGDLTTVAGVSTDKVGNLNALTTTDKTSIVGGVNEINGKVEDVSNTLADYASLDIYISNSGEFPDANTVTKELVYINGFQSGLTNYPSEVSNTAGILFTRWFYYSGDLTVTRMQLVFTLVGKSFCRVFNGTSWTPWVPSGVGNLSDLTTTDKSSCVGAINEINSTKAKKYTYYTSTTGVNSIDLTQISFDELKIVVIAPLTGYSCVFELHVFKTDLSSTYLYYSTGADASTIKVGITQSLCILNTSVCEGVNVINDTVIKVYYR